MFVKEILARKGRDVKRIGPQELLEAASAYMRLQDIGALIVIEGDSLVGTLSEKDVVRAIVDCGPRALQMPVREFMRSSAVVCSAEDTVAKVAKMMTMHHARHVPVLDKGAVQGIISIGDVVKDRFEEMELERDTLRDIAQSRQLAV